MGPCNSPAHGGERRQRPVARAQGDRAFCYAILCITQQICRGRFVVGQLARADGKDEIPLAPILSQLSNLVLRTYHKDR